MTDTEILDILIKQGYPDFMFELTLQKIRGFQPNLMHSFIQWSESGEIPNLTVEGFSYLDLIDSYDMKPIGAFITLDWLTREPEIAKRTLKAGFK